MTVQATDDVVSLSLGLFLGGAEKGQGARATTHILFPALWTRARARRTHSLSPPCADRASTRNSMANSVEEECVVCLNAQRTVRFGCGHMVACATCAQLLHARGDPCPVCRHDLDAAGSRFVDVSPGSNKATFQEVTIPSPPSAQAIVPARAAGTTSGPDAVVLRYPRPQEIWTGNPEVSTPFPQPPESRNPTPETRETREPKPKTYIPNHEH